MKNLILCLLISLLFVACKKGVPLNNPSMSVQAKNSSQVETAIKNSLKNRRWAITRQVPGQIDARYSSRNASANIKITYTKANVNVTLVNSENLLQGTDETGAPVIHTTYNRWVKYLENDIYIELSHL